MKRLIKRGLLWVSSVLYGNVNSKVLYYHDVYSNNKYSDMGTPLSLFKKHINIVRNSGYEIVDYISKDDKEILICFDDGFRGLYDTKDFFLHERIRPTVFLASSLIGEPGYLNVDEIKELISYGFKFQCHSWSHLDLTSFTREELKHELYDSKQKLSLILEKEVDEICFPIGYFSQLVIDECIKYGYKTMYSSIPGNHKDKVCKENVLTRNLVQFATPTELSLILKGGNQLLKKRYSKMHIRK